MGVLVLGAGVAGLSCARALAAAGREVRVLEKSPVLGGRVACRSLGGAPFAYGAPDLGALGEPNADVRAFVSRLAQGTVVEHGLRARRVVPTAKGALVELDDGARREAEAVVVATPAPQAVDLVGPAFAGPIAGVGYTRTVVGAWRAPEAEDLDWVPPSPLLARVLQRGTVRVAHVRPGPSAARWDDLDDTWLHALEDELARLGIPTAPGVRFLKRWRYAVPIAPVAAPFHAAIPGRVVVCGDAFVPAGTTAGTTDAARASGEAAAAALLHRSVRALPATIGGTT